MNSIHVVLCTYNGECFLEQMLNSIASQTVPAKTVTVLDDASSDKTCSIVESFAEKLPLHFYRNATNTGHRAAFSKALEYASQFTEPGDFIAMADQDDVWNPQKNEILLKEIKGHALVFGDAQIIDGKGLVTAESWRAFDHISPDTNMKRQIAGINNVTGMLSLFKVELLKKILPIPEGVTVHDRWIAMMALKNGGIKDTDKIVAQYRIHGNNAVGGVKAPKMSETLAIQIRWIETILENQNRLQLEKEEIQFANHLLKLSKDRQVKGFIPLQFFWIFKNRKNLFLKGSFIQTSKRILFTTLGLPLAQKIFHKS